MKAFRIVLMSTFLIFGITGLVEAQDPKIGYTNIELLMAYMPEVQQIQKSLDTYQKELSQKLQTKEDYYNSKVSDYLAKDQSNSFGSEADKIAAQGELQKLEMEIQESTRESENLLQARKQEMMQPLLNKIQEKIDEVASEGNFTYILNQTSGNNMLYGLKTMDVTKQLAAKLGISLPARE